MTDFLSGIVVGVIGTLGVSLALVLRMMEQVEPLDGLQSIAASGDQSPPISNE